MLDLGTQILYLLPSDVSALAVGGIKKVMPYDLVIEEGSIKIVVMMSSFKKTYIREIRPDRNDAHRVQDIQDSLAFLHYEGVCTNGEGAFQAWFMMRIIKMRP
jgi:hypothetical protein